MKDFKGEKKRLYCWFDLHILTYLLTAVKPMVTGEIYSTYGPKKAIIWQTALPKGQLPDISTPAAKRHDKNGGQQIADGQCDNIEIRRCTEPSISVNRDAD